MKVKTINFLTIVLLFASVDSVACRESLDDDSFKKSAIEFTSDTNVVLYKFNNGRFAVSGVGDSARYYLQTGDYSAEMGYQGATYLEILISPTDEILQLSIMKSEETPAYVKLLRKKGFLKNFCDQKVDSTIEVDAISGATMTSNSIKNDIIITLETFQPVLRSLIWEKRKLICSEPELKFKTVE